MLSFAYNSFDVGIATVFSPCLFFARSLSISVFLFLCVLLFFIYHLPGAKYKFALIFCCSVTLNPLQTEYFFVVFQTPCYSIVLTSAHEFFLSYGLSFSYFLYYFRFFTSHSLAFYHNILFCFDFNLPHSFIHSFVMNLNVMREREREGLTRIHNSKRIHHIYICLFIPENLFCDAFLIPIWLS